MPHAVFRLCEDLFDQGTPVPLRTYLRGHAVFKAYEQGWSNLENGDLLQAAERDGFECFVTTDQNLRYQQRLHSRRIAIAVLLSTSWPKMEPQASSIADQISGIAPGDFREISV